MATVSTRLGYEGIDCIPGEHLLAADSAEDFASTVRYLLEHPEERERLGRNARALVERDFSPQAFGDRIEAIYRDDKACG
jgi:glycosyltransferase involved in cell wall biosynthesis